jgi:hypothetical protein
MLGEVVALGTQTNTAKDPIEVHIRDLIGALDRGRTTYLIDLAHVRSTIKELACPTKRSGLTTALELKLAELGE